MKTQLYKFKDCEGKTVDKVYDDGDKVGISFLEDSFILITGEADYDGGFEMQVYEHSLSPEYHRKICEVLGLYTAEEIKKIVSDKEEKRKTEQEEQDRVQYLKLKKRFEK